MPERTKGPTARAMTEVVGAGEAEVVVACQCLAQSVGG